NIFVKYNPVLELAPQTVWESRLDTAFVHKPFLVENHYTKEKEILVQDLNNQLYLINPASGRILWKRPLSSSIVGEVSQVDWLRNNKLQYVFVTQDKLYLIDRNGKDVGKYPILLRSKAARGLSVFDYSNNRNYRFFVPGKNKKVYAYSKDGEILDGWKFKKAENPIISEVQHFRIKGKDYIVFADEYRVYILNRKGQIRLKPKKQIAKSKNNIFYFESANSKNLDRLVTTDREGNIQYFYMNGNVETKNITSLDSDHHFVARDIDADGSSEYIISDQNMLHVYETNGSLILEKEFSSTISQAPAVYRFSRNKCEIGICLKHDNELHLINTNGVNHKGFPLKGNTAFSIAFSKGTQKGFYLFACDDRNFLLNYSVKL
uniref:outer membrane protein assembly factor BamB family protein n=1 Tax=Ancylomarina sp. TaxID=1970196 RepID=UPI003562751B